MLQHFKRKIPFLLVILFFYTLAYPMIHVLPMDDLLRKALYVNNVLLYTPLIILLLSLVYAGIYGFSWSFSAWTTILFFATIVVWDEWIMEYQVVYFLLSLLGNALGALIHRLRKKIHFSKL